MSIEKYITCPSRKVIFAGNLAFYWNGVGNHQSYAPKILSHKGIESGIVQSELSACNGFPIWSPSLFCENYSLRAAGSQIHSKCVDYCGGNLGNILIIKVRPQHNQQL